MKKSKHRSASIPVGAGKGAKAAALTSPRNGATTTAPGMSVTGPSLDWREAAERIVKLSIDGKNGVAPSSESIYEFAPPAVSPSDSRPDPRYLPAMPLQVRMLADSIMIDPRRPLKVSADAAGLTMSEARAALRRRDVREYMGTMLDQAGATVQASCMAISDALCAVKVIDTIKNPETGDITPVVMPDHEYRLRSAELSLKLRGLLMASEASEQPLTLSALIVQIQEARERRGLGGTVIDAPSA